MSWVTFGLLSQALGHVSLPFSEFPVVRLDQFHVLGGVGLLRRLATLRWLVGRPGFLDLAFLARLGSTLALHHEQPGAPNRTGGSGSGVARAQHEAFGSRQALGGTGRFGDPRHVTMVQASRRLDYYAL